MTRDLSVIDCWFDSGAMPFAQYHYPFENKELWESQFPADFISEGIDQTRGWFYSLLVISVFVTGKSPYKNVLVNELLLDKNGQKMHKSKGNAIEPFTLMGKYGADVIRWYIPYVSPVWTPLKFDEDGLKEVYSKFFNPLKNTYSFFQTYANIDGIDIDECHVPYSKREEIDKWLISKYNKLLQYVAEEYDKYDLNAVVRAITDFVSDDLSNWYIRRNRDRFWSDKLDNSKKAVYETTYEVLVGLCEMCAPIIPFTTEEIYTKLTGKDSVHLADFPKSDKKLIDEHIERRMDLVRSIISIGRYVREEAKIKVRQPLSECLLDGQNEELISDLVDLIKEELNIKEIKFVDNLSEYMNMSVKPNFKVVGKELGPLVKEFQTKLEGLSEREIEMLQSGQSIELNLGGEDKEITPDMVDIRISSKEGFNVGMENNNFIILDTTLTDDLILEGIAREMVSKVQQLRKNKDFNVADRITLYYNGDEDIDLTVKKFNDYIKHETLSLDIVKKDNLEEKYDLNGHDCYIDVER